MIHSFIFGHQKFRRTRSLVLSCPICRVTLVSCSDFSTVCTIPFSTQSSSGKKICIQMQRLRPDTLGARDALDAPCQRTYHSQCKTHRQREFGRSSPRHCASGCRSPRHLLTRRSVSGHFPSGRTVSGHFPSGRSCVRVFSFWTQPCQGIFLLDAAVSGHCPSGCSCVRAFSYWMRPADACHGSTVTLAVKARNVAANTRVAFANMQRVPGIVTESSPILYIYSMYIYICYYTLRVSSKSTQRHAHRRDHHMQ